MVEEARPSIPSTGKKRLSRRGRQIILQMVVGLIILICGVIIGSGAAVLRLKDEMIMRRGPFPPTSAIVEDMQARYGLTEKQAKQVEVAFEKRRETVQTIFDEFRRKSESEFQKLNADIKKILTPEQYEQWEQDFKRRRRPGPRDRGPRGPGGRGPGRGRPDGPPRRPFGGGRFDDGGPRRDLDDKHHEPWGPNFPDPNGPRPAPPEPNSPREG